MYEEFFPAANPVQVPWMPLPELAHLVSHQVVDLPFGKQEILAVQPKALRALAKRAFTDIAHLLRPGHLQQLANILADPEASDNDRFTANELLRNATIAARGGLPGCQDTGTAIITGKKGQCVFTDGKDEEHLSHGVYDAYTKRNLRYSQCVFTDGKDEEHLSHGVY